MVFNLIWSKWKPTILWRVDEGDRRFADLRRSIGPISEKVLAEQLRQLVRDGLVVRTAGDGFPLRVDYGLSADGAELNALLGPIAEWGDRIGARTPAAAQASDAHIVDQ
ncbi:helix-turn-helix domain-containing protein [Rhodococcus sp. IEGM 1370]|uniref:winged helix-turn-helix transcriptional regulator n=1 Tax=Rhodococcus sp. IEGM 1370 TaxID=3082222 RepID=UPI00295365F5|nr:helix-turn-helix domain-containing protein [Rhodococcus sp. IEGM 1370]MDV8077314.1 helix-turn-helix domain-containing protein [Rhodococcus sp. IEGM 1370]